MKKQIMKGGDGKPGGEHGGISGSKKSGIPGNTLASKLVISEKPLAAERTLPTRLEGLSKEFRAQVDFEKFSSNPDYSGAVQTLWEIALADKKQGEVCMGAVKEALECVVLHEAPWNRILFYVTLRGIPLPVDFSGGLKQKHEIFSFLMDAERAKGGVDQFALNVLVDCIDSLMINMHGEPSGKKETIN